jgi:uncharacterized membrane protein
MYNPRILSLRITNELAFEASLYVILVPIILLLIKQLGSL